MNVRGRMLAGSVCLFGGRSGNEPPYIHERAKAYQMASMHEEAWHDFTAVLMQQPNNARAYFRRAFSCKVAVPPLPPLERNASPSAKRGPSHPRPQGSPSNTASRSF